MQELTREILTRFPVRKTREQKAAFRAFLKEGLTAAGYAVTEEREGKLVETRNVAAGDLEGAKVVFAAHYDTCARLPFPNLIFPRSLAATLLVQLPLVVVLCGLVFGLEFWLIRTTGRPLLGLAAAYALLLGLVWMMMAGPIANPSNVNDNTSGVMVLTEIALTLPEALRKDAAFLFFDNEEKGLLGSMHLKKRHPLARTPLINFDCVSDGEKLYFFPAKGARGRADLLALLETCYEGEKPAEVVRGFGMYPSDQMFFPLGIGVAGLNRCFLGEYLGKIHTARDRVLQEENLEQLRRGSIRLAEALAEKEERS